jgi:hypothetical protein
MSRDSRNVSFAKKIIPRCRWADIVLPINKKEQLRQILISAKRHAETLKIRIEATILVIPDLDEKTRNFDRPFCCL